MHPRIDSPAQTFPGAMAALQRLSKAVELGFSTVGCASTGNLANSVAANAAAVGESPSTSCRRVSRLPRKP